MADFEQLVIHSPLITCQPFMDNPYSLLNDLYSQLSNNADLALFMVGISVLTFVGSLILIPWLIIRLPESYFSEKHRRAAVLKYRHPLVYWLIRISKNLLALVLIVAGIAMLVLPGQGLLSILIGISISDFPGKYRLERYLVSRPGILKSLNWIRRKAGKPLLVFDTE